MGCCIQCCLEDVLRDPAVMLPEGHLLSFGGIDVDEVGVVLRPFPITDLEEDLDEAEASSATSAPA